MKNLKENCSKLANVLIEKVNETREHAIEKITEGKDLFEATKSLEEAKVERDQLAAQIGYAFYERWHANNVINLKAFENEFDALEEINDYIAILEEQLHEMRGIKTCPECGTKIDQHTKFCPECGEPQKTDESEEAADKNHCPSCGIEIEPDQSFCKDCGTDLR